MRVTRLTCFREAKSLSLFAKNVREQVVMDEMRCKYCLTPVDDEYAQCCGEKEKADRIAELEAKNKYQDEVIEQRNAECSRQFKRIAVLEEELAKRVPVGLLGVLTEKIDDKLMSVLNERMIGSEIGNA